MPPRRSAGEQPASWEEVKGRETQRLAGIIRPWTCLLAVLAAGAILAHGWPGTGTAAIVAVAGLVLAVLSWHLTRHRKKTAGRLMPSVTVAAAAAWLAAAAAAGLTHRLLGAWIIGGMVICLSWNIWTAVREDGEAGSFLRGAEKAGLTGLKIHGWKIWPHRAEGIVRTPPGQLITDDLVKHARYIEAGAQLPPGAISISPHEDNAAHARLIISDPRLLNRPIPWPGPSIPRDGSIASPVIPGIWQDGEPVEYSILNHHLQVMGATGSGKTTSAAYNEMGETITRTDAGILAVDIVKRRQFLGPLEPALHYLATTREQALELAALLHVMIPDRAEYLEARGLQKWEKGCGLTHITFWVEEVPAFIMALDRAGMDEEFNSDVNNARSAAIRIVLSLQRSDFTQMPTIIRSQLDQMCFGCKNEQDENFGLSPRQRQRGCAPSDWGTRFPGRAYLDSACVPDDRIAMPLRCYDWGRDSKIIGAHAQAYPASGRPLDPLTAGHVARLARPAQAPRPRDGGTVTITRPPETDKRTAVNDSTAYDDPWDQDTPDPADDPDFTVPPGPLGSWKYTEGRPVKEMEPADALAAFREQINEWSAAGKHDFDIEDLFPLMELCGKSRPWLYSMIAKATAENILRKDGRAHWVINRAGGRQQ